jgi:hypothetical protein
MVAQALEEIAGAMNGQGESREAQRGQNSSNATK